MTCNHDTYKKKRITKHVLGETFRALADTCLNCEAVLWDENLQTKFNIWLKELYASHKDRFTVQIKLENWAIECLDRLEIDFPGTNRSQLIRVLVHTYLEHLSPNPAINDLIESKLQDTLRSQGNKKAVKYSIKINYKPFQYLDLLGYSEVSKLSIAKVVENSLKRCLAILIKSRNVSATEEELNSELLQKVSQALRAA